jgi:hypothetical protein
VFLRSDWYMFMIEWIGADKDWHAPIADDLEFTTPAELKDPVERSLSHTESFPPATKSDIRMRSKSVYEKPEVPESVLLPSNRKQPRRVATRSRSTKAISLDCSSPPKLVKGKRLPSVRMRIDDEPLAPSSDGEDELLLTSRGWDWEPGFPSGSGRGC